MAKVDFKSVDEYIAAHSAGLQSILRRVRSAIRKAVPDAEEVISYPVTSSRLWCDTGVTRVALWGGKQLPPTLQGKPA